MIVHERSRHLGWQNVCKELLRKTIIIAPSSSPMIEFNFLFYIVCLFLCPLLPLHLKVYDHHGCGAWLRSQLSHHPLLLVTFGQTADDISNACTLVIFTIIHYKICRKCWGPCLCYAKQGTGNVCRQFINSLCNVGLSLDFVKIYVQQRKSI